MQVNNQQLKDELKIILEKGKQINDIVFISKKMTRTDIAFMLWFLRPIEKKKTYLSWKTKNDGYYGMEDDTVNNMLNEPIFGGDYVQQLVFGCIAALEVYTEDEILRVLEIQEIYADD